MACRVNSRRSLAVNSRQCRMSKAWYGSAFFQEMPKEADPYYALHVLHCWIAGRHSRLVAGNTLLSMALQSTNDSRAA